jgi:iron complex outermembrane receptor protein
VDFDDPQRHVDEGGGDDAWRGETGAVRARDRVDARLRARPGADGAGAGRGCRGWRHRHRGYRVTAERRETNLQDTPISITALKAGALEAQGVRSVNDRPGIVPNLIATTGPQGSSDANFFIGGVGQFAVIATNDPGVGIHVDGVYLGRIVWAMLDPVDIARI